MSRIHFRGAYVPTPHPSLGDPPSTDLPAVPPVETVIVGCVAA